MTYQLHPAAPHHFATLGEWIGDAEQCLRWAGPKLDFPLDRPRLQSLLETEPGDSYALLDQHGQLAGFGQIFHREPGAAHLGRIIIDPRRRQQGVGQILCSELIKAAASTHGLRSITLWVYLDNPPAVQLYRTLGFVAQAREGAPGCQFMRLNLAQSGAR